MLVNAMGKDGDNSSSPLGGDSETSAAAKKTL